MPRVQLQPFYLEKDISGGPKYGTTFSGALFPNCLAEFHKTSKNLFLTCFQSHGKFSKHMNYNVELAVP